jgi:prepilin-type N-terminal cleavage/methylation domain-containing protein
MLVSINKLRNKKGFTLIELIVVLAVLAIIMAIAVPRFVGVQEEAKVESDRATLANIVKISEFYLVKGKMEAGETYEGAGLLGIIEADFPNGVEFQSKGNEEAGLEAVTVNITETGVVSASIGDITYPKVE